MIRLIHYIFLDFVGRIGFYAQGMNVTCHGIPKCLINESVSREGCQSFERFCNHDHFKVATPSCGAGVACMEVALIVYPNKICFETLV